jgi:hypothetical protein
MFAKLQFAYNGQAVLDAIDFQVQGRGIAGHPRPERGR